ncbi:MAG: site-specific DNA-methyltransferase [Elusimicrobiota bacterium]
MAKNNYQNWSKEELVAEIERLKKRKKYGLVWEEKPEDVVELCKTKLPILKEVKSKEIITDKNKPVNLLIEGDNYHALSVLNYTHQNKIDVIYIDPPYNTGNKDFKYNDKYVDLEDGYRHSKWLAFMEKRLKLAKNLLKDTGIIFISIDDNEQAQLRVLCNEIYGENNFVVNLVWENKEGGGSSDSKHFKIKHEYILVYAKDINTLSIKGSDIEDEDRYCLEDKYAKKRGKYQLVKLNSASIQYSKSLDYPIKSPNGKNIFPSYGNKQACWRWSKAKLEWGIKNDFVVIKKDKNEDWAVYTKQYLKVDNEGNPIEREKRPIGVIPYYSTTMANKQLENIFHKKTFDYSKPYLLIKYLVDRYENNNAIVLDFMAGSGTTGQSVLELNKEDKGNRQFILCTNNENNICTDVCYPRIEKVIKGYKNSNNEKIAGLEGNLKYFRTDFVDAEPTDKNKRKLTEQATEMLCIKEGTFEPVLENKKIKIFKNGNHYTGIIFDQLVIPDFKKKIKDIKAKFSVYVFSLGDDTFDEEFEDMKKKVKLSPIPEAILRVYRRIFI